MLGNKQIAKVLCVCCGEFFSDHTKRGLMRCLFRVQGTMVSNGIQGKIDDLPEVQEK